MVSTQQMKNVNWISIRRAFRKKNIVDKLPIFNLLHNKWPENMKVVKRDSHKNPLCDRCQVLEETFNHIFCCRSKDAADIHKKAIAKVSKDL